MKNRIAFAVLGLLLLVTPSWAQGTRAFNLVPTITVGPAGTVVRDPVRLQDGVYSVSLQATFVYAAGGTTAKAFVQTSTDGGASWYDVACFAFTTASAVKVSSLKLGTVVAPAVTPTDGTMTDNTILDGTLGDRLRVKVIVTGTYTGLTTLRVTGVAN